MVAVDADSLSLDSDSASGWSKAENYRGKRLLIVSGAAKGKSYIVSGNGVDSQGRPLLKAKCVSGMPKLCADRAKMEDFVSVGIRSGDGIKVLQYYEYDEAASVWTTLNGLAFATKETGDASFMNEALLNFRDSTNAHLSRSRFGGTAVAGDYLAFPFYFLQCLGGG